MWLSVVVCGRGVQGERRRGVMAVFWGGGGNSCVLVCGRGEGEGSWLCVLVCVPQPQWSTWWPPLTC